MTFNVNSMHLGETASDIASYSREGCSAWDDASGETCNAFKCIWRYDALWCSIYFRAYIVCSHLIWWPKVI